MKSTKVKALVAVVFAMLLVVASVFGTIAYLTDTTDEVVNTFVLGKLFDEDEPNTPSDPTDDNFVLLEHKAYDGDGTVDTAKDGSYTLKNDELVTSNSYSVLPGVDVPKDPFVATNKDVALDSYIFVEVINATGESGVNAVVDTDNWTDTGLVNNANGHGGKIYAMKANGGYAKAGQKLSAVSILKDNKLTVDSDAEFTSSVTVTFYGYMIQKAGFTDATDAAKTGFGFVEAE